MSSAYERDFANAVGGECLIIRTSTTSTKKSLQFKKAVDNMARSAVLPDVAYTVFQHTKYSFPEA